MIVRLWPDGRLSGLSQNLSKGLGESYLSFSFKVLHQSLRDVSALLIPGGRLVLSGLLKTQIPLVLNAYRAQGLPLQCAIQRGKWATLILKR